MGQCRGTSDAQRDAVGRRSRVRVRLAVRARVRRVERGGGAARGHRGLRVAVDAQRPAAAALPGGGGAARAGAVPAAAGGAARVAGRAGRVGGARAPGGARGRLRAHGARYLRDSGSTDWNIIYYSDTSIS